MPNKNMFCSNNDNRNACVSFFYFRKGVVLVRNIRKKQSDQIDDGNYVTYPVQI